MFLVIKSNLFEAHFGRKKMKSDFIKEKIVGYAFFVACFFFLILTFKKKNLFSQNDLTRFSHF